MEIAKNLHSFKQLTIITNAIDIAIELSKYKRFNVILLGGHLRDSSLSTVGPIAENTLKIFYCDKLFLGVDSFNLERGVSFTIVIIVWLIFASSMLGVETPRSKLKAVPKYWYLPLAKCLIYRKLLSEKI